MFPFIKHIRFPKVTAGEIKKVFDILRRESIIRPTHNIFDESNKQVAFFISDYDLRDLISQIWHVRNLELERLRKKLTYLVYIKARMESLEDRINQQMMNISKAYRKVIKKFDFPLDILEGICLNRISLA